MKGGLIVVSMHMTYISLNPHSSVFCVEKALGVAQHHDAIS